MIDVSELLRDPELIQPFQVKRESGSFQNEGEWIVSTSTVDMKGAVHPGKIDDVLKLLPEGERQANYIILYTTDEVRMGDGTETKRSDIVLWQDREYRVVYSKKWVGTGNYWIAIAQGFIANG